MSEQCKLLFIEDCPQDAFLTLRQLGRDGFKVECERVDTATDLERALTANVWDFILCDYYLPSLDALAALALYKESGLDIPFIVLSGRIGEEQAVKSIKAGAHEYVMKDDLAQLGPAIRRELQAAQERCIRRQAHATEALLASIVKSCHDGVIGETLDGAVVSWNAGAERLFGYSASEIMGSPASILVPPYRPADQPEILEKLKRGEEIAHFETVRLHKNRTPVEVSLTVSPIKEPRGDIIGTSTIARDNAPRRQMENERLALIHDLTAALAQTSANSIPVRA
jgi:PAS domain S-box-containing protein